MRENWVNSFEKWQNIYQDAILSTTENWSTVQITHQALTIEKKKKTAAIFHTKKKSNDKTTKLTKQYNQKLVQVPPCILSYVCSQ